MRMPQKSDRKAHPEPQAYFRMDFTFDVMGGKYDRGSGCWVLGMPVGLGASEGITTYPRPPVYS